MNDRHDNNQLAQDFVVQEEQEAAALAVVAPSRSGRPFLAIEDESEWYRRHGLPPNDGAYYEWYRGSNLSETNHHEACHRVQTEASYQRQAHRRVFRQQGEEVILVHDIEKQKLAVYIPVLGNHDYVA
jgi:hypothetical protein